MLHGRRIGIWDAKDEYKLQRRPHGHVRGASASSIVIQVGSGTIRIYYYRLIGRLIVP